MEKKIRNLEILKNIVVFGFMLVCAFAPAFYFETYNPVYWAIFGLSLASAMIIVTMTNYIYEFKD